MSTFRELKPSFSTSKDGVVVATVEDTEFFPHMENACAHVQSKHPQITAVSSYPRKSRIEITFAEGITQDDAATILAKVRYATA